MEWGNAESSARGLAPTADRVARVFGDESLSRAPSRSSHSSEEPETVDLYDLQRVRTEVDGAAAKQERLIRLLEDEVSVIESQFKSLEIEPHQTTIPHEHLLIGGECVFCAAQLAMSGALSEQSTPSWTIPTASPISATKIPTESYPLTNPAVDFPSAAVASASSSPPPLDQPKICPGAQTVLQEAKATQEREIHKMAPGSFRSFAAILEDEKLHSGETAHEDPKWKERRRGDSDLDWGDEEGAQEDDDGGMLVDDDLDPRAMVRFVSAMGAYEGREDQESEQG